MEIPSVKKTSPTALCALQRYLKQVEKVEAKDGSVSLLRRSDGTKYTHEKIIVNYAPHTIVLPSNKDDYLRARTEAGYLNTVMVFKQHIYPSGRTILTEIKPTLDKTGKAQIVVLNSRTYVNAIIRAAFELKDRGPSEDDSVSIIPHGYEYNHRLAGGLGLPEVFGPHAGEFIPKEQNPVHWRLVKRIFKETGLKVSIPGFHDQAYGLLGKKELSTSDVEELGYVKHGEYLEIPDSDTYRWCVSEVPTSGCVWVAPLFYGTDFSNVFGAHSLAPYEFQTYEDAMVLAVSLGYNVIRESCEIS